MKHLKMKRKNALNGFQRSEKCEKSRDVSCEKYALPVIHNHFSRLIGPNDVVRYDIA